MARDKEQALHLFWSQFCKSYDENTVPDKDKVVFPYITYELSTDTFDARVSLTASIWDRSDSWKTVTQIVNQISESIGMGGVTIPYDDGAIWITRGTPFSLRVGDADDTIRRISINIEAEYLSAN